MKEEHRKILEKSLEDSFGLQEKFSDFQLQTKVNLSLSQLQLFQSLGGLGLTLLAIGLSIEKINFNVWTILSIAFSSLLVIYTASLSREIIDYQDRGLWETGLFINKKHNQIQEKILDAISKNDSSIFFNFAQSELKSSKDLNENLSYAGELVVFLFYSLLYFGFLSIVGVQFNFVWLFGILLVALLSFKDWSMWLTKKFSIIFIFLKMKNE